MDILFIPPYTQNGASMFTEGVRSISNLLYLCAEVSGQRSSTLAADPERDRDGRGLWFDPAGLQ